MRRIYIYSAVVIFVFGLGLFTILFPMAKPSVPQPRKDTRIHIAKDREDGCPSFIITDTYSGQQWAVVSVPEAGNSCRRVQYLLILNTFQTKPAPLIKNPGGFDLEFQPDIEK